MPTDIGFEPQERICDRCIDNRSQRGPRCELCDADLTGDFRAQAPWCEPCERDQLVCISLAISRVKDIWHVQFWDCNQKERIAPERKFEGMRGMFTMVARTYNPGAELERLAYILHKPELATMQVRLTHE